MKHKNIINLFLPTFAVVFFLGFLLNLNIGIPLHAILSLIVAGLITLALSKSQNNEDTGSTKAYSHPTNKNVYRDNTIYVCEHLSSKIYYEIKGNKVYKHLSPKVIYEIKENKVYRALESRPILIIKGNLLYKPGEQSPAYRIENNKVYEGRFGRVPILSLRDEHSKYTHL